MKPAIHIPEKYASRYGLLGAFCSELGRGFGAEGFEVNPRADVTGGLLPPPRSSLRDEHSSPGGGGSKSVYVFFNNPPPVEQLWQWTGGPGGERKVVQWCVDHPLTLPGAVVDQLARDPGYRLLLVADDDLHLVQMRWPGVRVARCWHGVDESALCDEAGIEESHAHALPAGGPPAGMQWHGDGRVGRDIDVLLAGWIAPEAELARQKALVPAALHESCEEIVRLRLRNPVMSFGHAYDLAMPLGLHASDPWGLMSVVFAYTTSKLNRVRRVRVIQSLGGLNVGLLGDPSLREMEKEADGVRYLGQAEYHELPGWLKRTKVSIALGPTQFVHSFSERLLLSLAAGCATVADDRHWVREQFGQEGGPGCVDTFPIEWAPNVREPVEKLLADPARRAAMGTAGRAIVAREHLWRHRVPVVMSVAGVGIGH